MESEYLKIERMRCGYPGGFQLGEISFGLQKGALAGIIGPNGSGKTTIFRGIAGSLPLSDGSVWLQNTDLAKLKPSMKARRLAVVAQFPDVADITVEDYVLMGRLPYREMFQFFESRQDHLIAQKYMKLTGIYEHRTKLMTQLSGGEQQLAAIAQALSQEPELLLLDEPTSHLDISHAVQILNLIQRLNYETGLTVLMIIHDLNLAAEYCDYLVMMDKGRIFTKGTPEEVLNYRNIEDVYKTVVVTQNNPLSGKPAIFLVTENIMREQREKHGGINR
jgi:iron complex transport system ATP-binding protein